MRPDLQFATKQLSSMLASWLLKKANYGLIAFNLIANCQHEPVITYLINDFY